MFIRPEHFQAILAALYRWSGLTQKEIAARLRKTASYVGNLLSRERKTPLERAEFEEALPGLGARPAHAAVTAAWLESLEALEADQLTPEERDAIELWLLGVTREIRKTGLDLALRARETPPLDEYPKPQDREPARWLARAQLEILRPLGDDLRFAAVRSIRKYQHWALAVAVAHESEHAASKSIEKAEGWARLAVEVAEQVRGPEGWQRSVRAYASGAGPNVLRVRGQLDEASAGLGEARRLWQTGSDPDRILDPGRLLDLEGSLRRDQRRFGESLDRLDEALTVTHDRARVLVKKGFTLEVMGEYQGALAALREAESLIDRQRDPRLWYQQKFNLAVLSTHLHRFDEAAALVGQVLDIALGLGDDIFLSRLTWLRGRIAAGLEQAGEARRLLEQARQEFDARGMWFDVALAFLELAALLLREGRLAEVRALAPTLAGVFKSKKVHREALVALRLFRDAVEQEEATEVLARRVLRFLFRARNDQGLKFES